MLSALPLHRVRPISSLFSLHSLLIGELRASRCRMDQPVENRTNESTVDNGSRRFADQILPHLLNLIEAADEVRTVINTYTTTFVVSLNSKSITYPKRYASRATARDFEMYAEDATFEDPLMCAHGVKQIKSSFYSLKVFSESSIVEYSIKENVVSPGKHEILIDNKQHYKFMGRDIDMISLIKLDVEGGKVIRHEDRWDKKPLLSRDTVGFPLVGRAIEMARRGSMLATHLLMGFGKDP